MNVPAPSLEGLFFIMTFPSGAIEYVAGPGYPRNGYFSRAAVLAIESLSATFHAENRMKGFEP